MTIYEGWETPQFPVTIKTVNVGKPCNRIEPSAKAKTVKLGMKFTGPYQFLDTSTGEMRQTMPTLTRDEIRLQAGILRHNKRNQSAKKTIWDSITALL